MYDKFSKYLTTDLLKEWLPALYEEYGSKPLDFQITMSNDVIKAHWPKSKVSGIIIN